MAETEFIIALTEHRFLGSVFIPYLIKKEEQFYTVVTHVKKRDLYSTPEYNFKPFEKELVEIIERYSDEKLMKKFSRAESVTAFYGGIKGGTFEKQVVPFVEKCMFQVASILMLSPVRLLNKQVKYANLYDEDEIEVQPFYAKPVFHFQRTETETRYRLKVFLGDKEISLQSPSLKVITSDPCLLLHQDRLLVFEKLNAKKLTPFFSKEFVSVPNTLEESYYSGFIQNTIRDFEVHASGFRITDGSALKKAKLSLERNLKYEPCLVLIYQYGEEQFPYNSSRETAVNLKWGDDEIVFRKTERNSEWEQMIMDTAKSFGLKESNGYFAIPGADLLLPDESMHLYVGWIGRNQDQLGKAGIIITQERLDKKYFTGEQQLEIKTQSSGDWFDVYAIVRFGEFNIPFIRLKKYILNDIHEFELPNGEIAFLPDEWFARYKGLLPFSKANGDKMSFEKHHFPLLQDIITVSGKSAVKNLMQLTGKPEPVSLPENLKANLRHYQQEGYSWMYGLYTYGFGGCLADDMGLGKTLQTLALLLKLKRKKAPVQVKDPLASGQLDLFGDTGQQDNIQTASLIVLPTSLVHNWEAEIRKFTPSLNVYKHVGAQRKQAVEMKKIAGFYDLILTTYGTLRNDYIHLAGINFFYLILDESQFIKNPASKTYKAVMSLKSSHRLVLTGTPIENSLSDLWAQMNFLNKGVLGNLAFFKRNFLTPIEKHNNKEQQEKLQLIIKPFILRRTKEEVAKDLPPLMEQVLVCDMSARQQKIYEHEKSVIRNTILQSIEDEGMEKSGFVILQGLTRLRQLANHPSLVEDDHDEESGKFQEIFRMLENLVAENHKVLIFSSFVSHLELIRDRIEKYRWKYSKLIGQTTKREEVIRQFQNDPENRIFLISLKAGGVGLNLTEADYVFIVDPWWNPAAENQAINRAHRIGQNKHVFVYRFITENSIEEKIQLLKNRKSSLADKFINSNNPFQEISKEEVVDLFN